MGKPLPVELRRRVVAYVDDGHGHREAARRRGQVGGGKLEPHAEFVRLQLAETGELTLDELCVELELRGVSVHRSNVGRLLNRLALSHKKTLQASEQLRADQTGKPSFPVMP